MCLSFDSHTFHHTATQKLIQSNAGGIVNDTVSLCKKKTGLTKEQKQKQTKKENGTKNTFKFTNQKADII